eukprot:8431670-Heterocapsa_arctica.AAC.1
MRTSSTGSRSGCWAIRLGEPSMSCWGSARRTTETADEIAALACVEVEEEEVAALQEELAIAKAMRIVSRKPTRRMLRRRMVTLRAGATPGPSGWRNAHILAAMDITGGADAILGFAGLVAAGRISGRAADLWNAAVLEPVDCGEAVQEDPTAMPKRKLRPIGLSEAL